MVAHARKTQRTTRNYADAPVSIIVRYDFDLQQWIHSAGVVLTVRETSVMCALASAEKTTNACKFACCSESLFDSTVAILKKRFGVKHRSELQVIAAQLFPTNIRGRGSSNQDIQCVSGAND